MTAERKGPQQRWAAHATFALATAVSVGDAIAVNDVDIVTRKKGRANFATAADHAAESAILSAIRAHDPGTTILAEESAEASLAQAERLWVVDPLDGTLNFSRSIPFYCVAIAYVEDGRVRAGAVYAPRLGESFAASDGGGATLNGRPISVSGVRRASEAFAASSLGFRGAAKPGSRFLALNAHVARLRIIGAAALEISYVAAGRIDLFVHEFLSPWDIAAAGLIAREAGAALVSLRSGTDAAWDEQEVIIGTPAVVKDALATMTLVKKKRR